MAEGRILKRQISDSKKLGALKSDSARLLYTWLIPWLDIEDRHTADPDLIKGRIFPKCKSWNIRKIERGLEELNDGELIILYEANGEVYLQFTKTLQKKYRDKEAPSKIPPPPENSGELQKTPPKIESKSKSKFKSKEKSIAHEKKLEIFDEIWDLWWRKEDEGKAKEKYLALINKGIDPEEIKKACIGYLRCEKSKGTSKWFIKYLKTFLYDGNEKKKIPSTWRPFIKYGDDKYKLQPKI